MTKQMPDLSTSFEFKLISDFAGYNSSRDKTNIKESYAVRGSKNIIKRLSGTWASRCGMKRRGTADTTAAEVKSEKTWYDSKGHTRVLRVANSKLQFESDIVTSGTYVWYDLMTSLAQTRFVFDAWWDNTDKKDKLLFVAHDANIYSWAGGVSYVAAQAGGGTITKSGTTTWAEDGFASTGTVTINSVDYAYTGGTTTTTLTGVTPTTAITAGVGFSKVVTTSNTPASTFTNDFIKVIGNRLYCCSENSRLIYISYNNDFTNFTVPSPQTVGSAAYQTLDSAPKGITVRQGNAYIGAGTSDWYIISFSQEVINNVLVERCNLEKKQVANLQAPYSHEMIDVVGDTIVFLSQDQQLRTYGDYRNLFQPAYPCLSQAIFNELDEEDFTGGGLRAIGDYIYITAPVSGKVYLHQTRLNVDANGNITADRFWHPYQQWNATRIDEIDGVIYAYSNANPQMYQIWDTFQYHDDAPDDENIQYECVLRMAYRSHGRRQGLLSFDKLYVEGYMSQGTELKAYIFYEYQGSAGVQNQILNSNDVPVTLFKGNIPPAIGDASIGDNPLGDGLTPEAADQESLPKFKVIKSVTLENCTEYQLVVYSDTIDSRWEVLALGTNAQLETEQQAVHLITK